MQVSVIKLTDVELLRKANSFTTGKDSNMTLAKCYACGHSNMRTQLWWIELCDIPAFVVVHLVRHVHAQPYVRSKRTDRGGEDFRAVCSSLASRIFESNNCGEPSTEDLLSFSDEVAELPRQFDRYAPQSVALLLNAEEIINISKARLCSKASPETREVWQEVVNKIREIDPDLAKHCVPQCMYRGGICPEPKGCGYNKTGLFNKALTEYKKLFT